MKQSYDHKVIPMTSVNSGKFTVVSQDVAYYTNQIVNLIMIGKPGESWVLIDAGMPGSGEEIIKVATERFGPDNAPKAIILTHGHFDHTGGIMTLLLKWNVPVYAHPLELPFLSGEQAYPEPDTSFRGRMLAKISSLYPHKPIDIYEFLHLLPSNGIIPDMPGWRWIHVPGHTPGQIAFFREEDRLLISGDAIVTVRQDSLYRVLFQKKEICGPPVYLTTDWEEALKSVKRLAALKPEILISGHGTAMEGEELKDGLCKLLKNWNEVAVPDHGKWVNRKRTPKLVKSLPVLELKTSARPFSKSTQLR